MPNLDLVNPKRRQLTGSKLLGSVRTAPGQKTSYYAALAGVSQGHARQLLLSLLKRGLVGRQEGMPGLGNYESTWIVEEKSSENV